MNIPMEMPQCVQPSTKELVEKRMPLQENEDEEMKEVSSFQ